MITFTTILVLLFIVLLVNFLIVRFRENKFPDKTKNENLRSTEKVRQTVLTSGLAMIFIAMLYINFFYKTESEIAAEKERKEKSDKISAEKLARENDIKRLGLTSTEVEILLQHEIPVNNLADEVKNAYEILKSQKYFVDTEIIRFTGLAKKTKGSEFAKRIEKTKDSLIKNKDAIGKKQIADLDRKTSLEESKMRLKYGENLRNLLLDKGLDIKVTVFGKDNKKIRLTYILFNDVWFRKFETLDYFDMIHEKGFNHIELSDGYDYARWMQYGK
ncbi:MAG: hypothetical protein GXO46_05260 [Chlorobi bacterium]|uniref:hypothetical protein n=1 Tax=Chryseobacterium sp. VD8 TaxID=3081254 RepID=UPI0024508434|nr:hypothetical protein [Chlorobiota bacterium]